MTLGRTTFGMGGGGSHARFIAVRFAGKGALRLRVTATPKSDPAAPEATKAPCLIVRRPTRADAGTRSVRPH